MAKEEMKELFGREALEYVGGAYVGSLAVKYMPSNIVGISSLGNWATFGIGIVELIIAYLAKGHKDVMRIFVGAGLYTSLKGLFDVVYPSLSA